MVGLIKGVTMNLDIPQMEVASAPRSSEIKPYLNP